MDSFFNGVVLRSEYLKTLKEEIFADHFHNCCSSLIAVMPIHLQSGKRHLLKLNRAICTHLSGQELATYDKQRVPKEHAPILPNFFRSPVIERVNFLLRVLTRSEHRGQHLQRWSSHKLLLLLLLGQHAEFRKQVVPISSSLLIGVKLLMEWARVGTYPKLDIALKISIWR